VAPSIRKKVGINFANKRRSVRIVRLRTEATEIAHRHQDLARGSQFVRLLTPSVTLTTQGRVIGRRQMMDWKISGSQPCPNLRHYLGICLRRVRKLIQVLLSTVGFFVEIGTERLPKNKPEDLPLKPTCLFLAVYHTGAQCCTVKEIMLRISTLQLIVRAVSMHKEFPIVRNQKFLWVFSRARK
jgi:hypothetical protein